MPRTRRALTLLAAVSAVGTLACFGPEQPATVTVTPGTVTMDALGDTKQLSAQATDQEGVELTDVIFTWESSAPNVATVDSGGEVTAVAPGTSDVTATAGGVSGTAKVTVTQVISKVEATSGAQQTGTVGQALPQQLVVRVRDRLDMAVPGAVVTFVVSPNGGAVAPSGGTTGADGQLAATWTLGTTAGSFQVTANVTGAVPVAVFNGKANPGPAAVLTKVAGDGQYAYKDAKVDTLIAVRVRDQYGNGVPAHLVAFTATSGNGTPDSAVAFTDSTGVARTGWMMPGVSGPVALQASANASGGGSLLGSPLTFSATSHDLRVTSVSPNPMIEGQSATLDGSGFDPSPAGNSVTIDGVAATVTVASASQLTVTVPASDCRPARPAYLRVTVGGVPASPVSINLNPASFVNLAVGEQLIVGDPTLFCFQFPPAHVGLYLIGVQSVSENPSDLTAITLSGTGGSSASSASEAAAQRAPRIASWGDRQGRFDPERLSRWARHRAVELQQREADRITMEALRQPARAAAPRSTAVLVPPEKVVGDTVKGVRVSGGSCDNFTEITTVIREKGTNAFFLEDVANPSGGFTASHFTTFRQQFDDKTYPALLAEFGPPGADADGNSRIVVVVSREVNRRGSFGFTTSCDLAARATDPASNEGEFFYMVAPDPAGTINNDTLPLNLTLEVTPSILAHEPVHIMQFNRRKAAGASMVSIWLAEGQATLGEEVVGHATDGRTTGQNYGIDVAFNADDVGTDWYSGHFAGLGFYFGWDPFSGDLNGHTTNAPHECTWLSVKPQGATNWPCVGGADPYAAPWALLRWISDRFGPSYTGGEPGIQQALLDRTENGYALIQAVTGASMDSLLAQWAAMLYVDDRVNPLAAELAFASWNLYNIYYGTFSTGGFIRPALRLTPTSLNYSSFSQTANVRAGSAYYATIGNTTSAGFAVKARDGSGGILPGQVQLWIARMSF